MLVKWFEYITRLNLIMSDCPKDSFGELVEAILLRRDTLFRMLLYLKRMYDSLSMYESGLILYLFKIMMVSK
jgi:hypothetical protein